MLIVSPASHLLCKLKRKKFLVPSVVCNSKHGSWLSNLLSKMDAFSVLSRCLTKSKELRDDLPLESVLRSALTNAVIGPVEANVDGDFAGVAFVGGTQAGKSFLINSLFRVPSFLPVGTSFLPETNFPIGIRRDDAATSFQVELTPIPYQEILRVLVSQVDVSVADDSTASVSSTTGDGLDESGVSGLDSVIDQMNSMHLDTELINSIGTLLLGDDWKALVLDPAGEERRKLIEGSLSVNEIVSIDIAVGGIDQAQDSLRSLIREIHTFQHSALSKRELLGKDDIRRFLVGRLEVTGPFPHALVPNGLRVVDVPGLFDRHVLRQYHAHILLTRVSRIVFVGQSFNPQEARNHETLKFIASHARREAIENLLLCLVRTGSNLPFSDGHVNSALDHFRASLQEILQSATRQDVSVLLPNVACASVNALISMACFFKSTTADPVVADVIHWLRMELTSDLEDAVDTILLKSKKIGAATVSMKPLVDIVQQGFEVVLTAVRQGVNSVLALAQDTLRIIDTAAQAERSRLISDVRSGRTEEHDQFKHNAMETIRSFLGCRLSFLQDVLPTSNGGSAQSIVLGTLNGKKERLFRAAGVGTLGSFTDPALKLANLLKAACDKLSRVLPTVTGVVSGQVPILDIYHIAHGLLDSQRHEVLHRWWTGGKNFDYKNARQEMWHFFGVNSGRGISLVRRNTHPSVWADEIALEVWLKFEAMNPTARIHQVVDAVVQDRMSAESQHVVTFLAGLEVIRKLLHPDLDPLSRAPLAGSPSVIGEGVPPPPQGE